MTDNVLNELVEIPVDHEHGAFRASMVGLFVFFLIIGYIIFNALLPTRGLNVVALFLSLIIIYFLLQRIEAAIKERWPSGRVVRINGASIQLLSKKGVRAEIDGEMQTNVLTWRFATQRRSRVPKGWYVVACALEQNDLYLPVYTLMSPENFNELDCAWLFTALPSKKEQKESGLKRGSDPRMAGEQRRLHIAEQARWIDGVEMTVSDFTMYISELQARFPKWMPES
jgi:hypothetical protein